MNILYDVFGTPFGYLMMWIYNLVNNYGIAIILFTLVTKIILSPINYKTQKNAARMQLLNPKLQKLKKSYANNPQKMQEEQMKLYQAEGVNPMASCLPAVVQMVLLFGVLDVVYKPLTHILRFNKSVISDAVQIAIKCGQKIPNNDLRSELKILSAFSGNESKFSGLSENFVSRVTEFNSNFNFLGVNLGAVPKFSLSADQPIGLFLIPIFAGVAQLLYTVYTQIHQKRVNSDMPQMAGMGIMMYTMPIISIFFAYKVPAGVGFYWIFSSLFSLAITAALNAYFTNERIEAICEKDRAKARKYAEANGGKKTFMQKMLEQQQNVIEEQKKQATLKENGEKMSRSEVNAVNRKQINDARRRMAEKYGDDYSDEN